MAGYLEIIISFYAAASLALIAAMAADKMRAAQRGRRIPERTLILLGYLCGGLAGLASMQLFRHKTYKWYFYLNYIAAAVLHLFALAVVRIKFPIM